MATAGVCIGVVGATGALGGEVLTMLDVSSVHVAALRPYATDRSLGQDIEFQGELYPVETGAPSLAGLDLLFCCAPPAASLEWVREALRAEVVCIDCSGAVLGSPEVPVCVAGLALEGLDAPLLTAPPGAALAWALPLAPLHAQATIERVVGTSLEAASAAGRGGIDALYGESVALFNQEDPPEPDVIGRALAFDCLPTVGPADEGGATAHEESIARAVQRALGSALDVAVTSLQIPAFVGHAAQLAVDFEAPLDLKEARELLAAAPGVELWTDDTTGPNLRAASGRDIVIAGRIRRDPTRPASLHLWLVADALRLAAANAVALAAARVAAD